MRAGLLQSFRCPFCHLFDPLLVDPFNLFHLQTCLFIIYAFQERPLTLHLDGDGEDLDMFDQDEDAWSEEEEDYIL